MPFNWTLNPYRGCTHGCHYCFARRYQTQFELGPDDEFSSLIFVKVNLVEVLRARARQAVVDARAGRARHRHRSVPADRRPLQADARRRSKRWSRRGRPSASSRRDRWSCATAMCSPSSSRGRRLHGLRQRADGGRGQRGAALEPGTAHPMQRLRAVRRDRRGHPCRARPSVPSVSRRARSPRFEHAARRSAPRVGRETWPCRERRRLRAATTACRARRSTSAKFTFSKIGDKFVPSWNCV